MARILLTFAGSGRAEHWPRRPLAGSSVLVQTPVEVTLDLGRRLDESRRCVWSPDVVSCGTPPSTPESGESNPW